MTNDSPDYQVGQASPTYPAPQQYPSTQPYVSDAPQYEGPPQKDGFFSKNSVFIPVIAVILLGILGVGGYLIKNYTPLFKDSGVAACEAMAKQLKESDKKDSSDDNDKMTQKEYDKLRGAFADSRHNDIREPGVRLVDTIWNLQNTPEDKLVGVGLLSMGSMMSDLRGLQTGCKNHGVQVDFDLS